MTSRLKKTLLSVAAVIAIGAAGIATAGFLFYSGGSTSNVGELGFENELAVPPLAEPGRDDEGRRVFDLSLQQGETELAPGGKAQTWGANGPHLAPTLRATAGDEVLMRVRNELPEETTLHWHGMHLPAAADGGPHQMVEPGGRWEPSWKVDQPAATLWYHPHLMGETEDHVYRGLAGMFILDDPESKRLALPDDYGVDDIPVIVQDKRFDDEGRLDFSQATISPIGRLGDEILANGTRDPHLDVSDQRVRLRLLNASTARIYNFGLADDRPFELIGTDGGLLAAPESLTRIQLSPGERAEIVVELEPGEDAVLRSYEPELGGVDLFNERFVGGDDTFDVLELRAAEKLAPSPEVPERLVSRDALEPTDAESIRRFELSSSSSIDGNEMDMDRIDDVVTVDTTEVWEVENTTGIPHSFHVHDVRFRILTIDGEPPPPELAGLKDTVQVLPDETVRFVTEFSDYSDPAMPYMFHCHILEHEDRGMMGQFVVVEPGEEPALSGHDHQHMRPLPSE